MSVAKEKKGGNLTEAATEALVSSLSSSASLPMQSSPTGQKQAQLARKKMDPPPGFYRMREQKRRKELAKQQQQENASSPESRRLKPNRKRRSKKTSGISFEEIMNGAITDVIPEERTVCLESPSHNERVQIFREMFQEEAVATTVRKFLF